MRERVFGFFQNLPPEGIAIHGTNKSRARNILQEGFNPQKGKTSFEEEPLTWYIVQPPNINKLFWKLILDEIRSKTLRAQSHAVKAATSPVYWTGQNPVEDQTPAIVVFRPLQVFEKSSVAFTQAPFPAAKSEARPIPQNHVLGFFDIDLMPRPREMVRGVFNILADPNSKPLLPPAE